MNPGDTITRSFQAGIIAGRGAPEFDHYTFGGLMEIFRTCLNDMGLALDEREFGLGFGYGKMGYGCIVQADGSVKMGSVFP